MDAIYSDAEKEIFKMSESQTKQILEKLLSEYLTIKHRLDDPRYIYCGTRIQRYAILCREAQLDNLRETIKEKDALLQEAKLGTT